MVSSSPMFSFGMIILPIPSMCTRFHFKRVQYFLYNHVYLSRSRRRAVPACGDPCRRAASPVAHSAASPVADRSGACHRLHPTTRRVGRVESEDVCQDTCPVHRSPEHLGPILAAVPVSAQEDMEDETNIAARKPEGRSNLCGAMRRLHPMAR